MRWILLLLLSLSLGAFQACTTNDPGKKRCEIGTTDPALECVSGYVCKCLPDGCFCEKESGLIITDRAPPQPRHLTEKDPNIEFLKRLGVYEPRP